MANGGWKIEDETSLLAGFLPSLPCIRRKEHKTQSCNDSTRDKGAPNITGKVDIIAQNKIS